MPFSAEACFLDAGSTLILPTVPIPEVYLREAHRVGAAVDPRAFVLHLHRLWSDWRESTAHSPDELATSDRGEREFWGRFTEAVAAPFPSLRARHGPWLAALVEWFDAPAAWTPAPGAWDLIRALKARDTVVGVVSNWHRALHPILEGLGLDTLCDFVLTSADVGWRKPHPAIFQAALDQAGTTPNRAVHIGDAWVDDVLGAAQVGITPIFLAADPPKDPLPPGGRQVSSLVALVPGAA